MHVIKRYLNRKLYSVSESAYITLLDLKEIVKRGETIQVIDNATKQDITLQTLKMILPLLSLGVNDIINLIKTS
jgi:polyhydroxyalkanoate synthesis regulator protein